MLLFYCSSIWGPCLWGTTYNHFLELLMILLDNSTAILLFFPGGASGKEPYCRCRSHERRGFDPWVRKTPWRRAWQPTAVFLSGELQSIVMQRLKWLSTAQHTIVLFHCSSVVKSYLTLWDSMDCSFVNGISQARILEWVVTSFSRASSWIKDQTCISCIGRWILYHWATREAQVLTWFKRWYLHSAPKWALNGWLSENNK